MSDNQKADNTPQVKISEDSGIHVAPPPKTTKGTKDPKQHKRHSNAFITINTNQRFSGYEDNFQEFCQKFEDAILHTFRDNAGKLITIKKEEDIDKPDIIASLNLEYGIELAPNTGCVHAHLIFAVAHRTNMKLNIAEIRNQICEQMGLSNVFVNVRMFFNASWNIKDYIHKGAKQ